MTFAGAVWRGCLLFGLGAITASAELRIATYNVQNYTATDRRVAGVYRPEYPKPEVEKAALRQVIRAVAADVWAMQEMGSENHLRELQRDLQQEGCDYAHVAFLRAEDEQRGLGVLSRLPFAHVRGHDDLEFAYLGGRELVRRGMLEVRLAAPGGELTLFVVHFKSRYTERDDDPGSAIRRGAEATAARDRVLALFPGEATTSARFVVLGDFNDGPRSRAVRAFERRGDLPIAELLPLADSRGEDWTYRYARESTYTRVDHLMVSAALRPAVVEATGEIYDGPGTREASDHRPVIVTLSEPASAPGGAINAP